jgi:hypothetical protein
MRVRFHRNHVSAAPSIVSAPSHSVHVLRSEEELHEAVERAAEFHQRTATLLRARSEHYEALLAIRLDQSTLD